VQHASEHSGAHTPQTRMRSQAQSDASAPIPDRLRVHICVHSYSPSTRHPSLPRQRDVHSSAVFFGSPAVAPALPDSAPSSDSRSNGRPLTPALLAHQRLRRRRLAVRAVRPRCGLGRPSVQSGGVQFRAGPVLRVRAALSLGCLRAAAGWFRALGRRVGRVRAHVLRRRDGAGSSEPARVQAVQTAST
jgi:hypothetical protein